MLNKFDLFAEVEAKTLCIVDYNNTFIKKLGYEKNEIIGTPIFSIFHKSSIKIAEKELKLLTENGEIFNLELILKTKKIKKYMLN